MVQSAFDVATCNVATEWIEADVDEPGHKALNDNRTVANKVDDVRR